MVFSIFVKVTWKRCNPQEKKAILEGRQRPYYAANLHIWRAGNENHAFWRAANYHVTKFMEGRLFYQHVVKIMEGRPTLY